MHHDGCCTRRADHLEEPAAVLLEVVVRVEVEVEDCLLCPIEGLALDSGRLQAYSLFLPNLVWQFHH